MWRSARRRWRTWQPLRDVQHYVFLDECGVTTDLLRRFGRSPRGTRLHDHTPCGHWQTHTVIAGLRLEGLTAPAVFDGPIDTPTFRAYVEPVLVPTLRPGDVVILDNLAVHKHPEISAAIAAVGAQLRFLPPYSPDLNPIEQAFAKLKACLRAARPRSFDHVCALLAVALPLFTRGSAATSSGTAAIASLYRYEKRSSLSRRVMTTTSLPPIAVFETVIPTNWKPARPASPSSFSIVDVLLVANSL